MNTGLHFLVMMTIRFAVFAAIPCALSLTGCAVVVCDSPSDGIPASISKNPVAPSVLRNTTSPTVPESTGENAHPESSPLSTADTPSPSTATGQPELDLLKGSYGPIEMGMTENEVRGFLAEMGHEKLREIPMGQGKLLGISGINFRFTKEGILHEIYTLNRGRPIQGGFRLGHSTYAEYEDYFGPGFIVSPGHKGAKRYQFPDHKIELLLIPVKDDSSKVFSIMLQRKDLR